MYILGICDNPSVMEVARIVNLVITIIRIIVPIALIVSLMISYLGAVGSQNNDALTNVNKSIVPKFVAAAIIILMPTLVKIVTSIVDTNQDYIGCIGNISSGEITTAYVNQMDKLISIAESKLDMQSYSDAKSYLSNIKNESLKKTYNEKLENILEQIESNKKEDNNLITGYDDTDYGSGSFSYIEKTSEYMGYGIYIPENAGNTKLPLIVWLHGSGEVGARGDTFTKSGLLGVVNNWSNTGLKNIGAIIIAPKLTSGDWKAPAASSGIKKLIDKTINEYNINTNKIVLIGHSLGGIGVVHAGYPNREYFSALVILSGYDSSPGDATKTQYFTNIPLRGYSDSGSHGYMQTFFLQTNHSDDLFKLGSSHGQVPRVAMSIDNDKDGISDLVYWMLSQNKK